MGILLTRYKRYSLHRVKVKVFDERNRDVWVELFTIHNKKEINTARGLKGAEKVQLHKCIKLPFMLSLCNISIAEQY